MVVSNLQREIDISDLGDVARRIPPDYLKGWNNGATVDTVIRLVYNECTSDIEINTPSSTIFPPKKAGGIPDKGVD